MRNSNGHKLASSPQKKHRIIALALLMACFGAGYVTMPFFSSDETPQMKPVSQVTQSSSSSTTQKAKKTLYGLPAEQAKAGYDQLEKISRVYTDGKAGFMIITTEALKQKLKALPAFVYHKTTNRNFRVFLATEKDWEGTSEAGRKALQRGAFPARAKGHDILHLLKAKHKELQLKYVLFIGDPDPDHGSTPMLRIAHHKTSKNKIDLSAPLPVAKTEKDKKRNAKLTRIREKLVDKEGHYTEYGSVISDYPYVDLDTDWDANRDGFLSPEHDTNKSHTREPEVYVGRLLYYGEESSWAKAEDMDIILARCIRYDNEKDISWRYNYMYEFGKSPSTQKYLEEKGINYELISRFKSHAVGLPALKSRKGGKHIPNFEQIQDYPVGFKGCHSHGGPMGMEGFHSKVVSQQAHDKHPTILTLGACDIGNIGFEQNLSYTLLRFQSVAVSGGTGSVTGYGGNTRYVAENKLGKTEQLFAGKSVGEAHWGWYGGLYKSAKRIPMTGAKINIYGDPSVVPFRDGPEPPYPFLARPVLGHFTVADNLEELKSLTPHTITLSNNGKSAIEIAISCDQDWLNLNQKSFRLGANSSDKLILKANPNKTSTFSPGIYEAVILLRSGNYTCRRRFVLKIPEKKLRNYFALDGNTSNSADSTSHGGHGTSFSLPKSVTKFDAKSGKPKPQPWITGKFGKASNTEYPVGGYIEPFEKEDFTIASWVRFDQEIPQRGVPKGKIVLMQASNFLELFHTPQGLELNLRNYEEPDNPTETFSIKTNKTIQKGKWHHIAITVDQTNKMCQLYLDGKSVGSSPLKRKSIFATTRFSYGIFKGAADDLFIYSKCLNENDLNKLANGFYAFNPTPVAGAVGISPTKVVLSATRGAAFVSSKIVLKNTKTGETTKITPNKNSSWTLEALEPEQHYTWYLESGETKGPQWTFTTGTELFVHGHESEAIIIEGLVGLDR